MARRQHGEHVAGVHPVHDAQDGHVGNLQRRVAPLAQRRARRVQPPLAAAAAGRDDRPPAVDISVIIDKYSGRRYPPDAEKCNRLKHKLQGAHNRVVDCNGVSCTGSP